MDRYRPLFGGKYPAVGRGLLTAEASYADGFEHGMGWDRFIKNDYVPGGPHVFNAHHSRDADWVACCEASAENYREWMRGWHAGRKHISELLEEFVA